ALCEMLAFAPEYSGRFRALVTAVAAGMRAPQALEHIYGKSLDAVEADLQARMPKRRAVSLPPQVAATAAASTAPVNSFDVRLMMAEVLSLSQEFARGEALYHELDREVPLRAEVAAGLGASALARGDGEAA